MASSPGRRLSDNELRSADLVISDPLSLEGLTHEHPDERHRPEVVAEYHLPPSADAVPCSYCEQHQAHRHGLVARFAPGSLHLVGSSCGPDKLDLHFSTARRNHKELVDRQYYLSRLDAVTQNGEVLLSAVDDVLFSDRLKELDEFAAVLTRVAGDALIRLRSLILRGGPLTETVQQRDLEAERKRDEQLPEGKTGGPIYIPHEAPLGPLQGRAVLTSERLRMDVFEFKKALKETLAKMERDTDGLSTGDLKKMSLGLDRAWDEANTAVQRINNAPLFFETEHMGWLARWADTHSADRLEPRGAALALTSKSGRTETIGPIKSVGVGGFPNLHAPN